MTKPAEAAPLTGTRSASRIPLPVGENGARSATHLAALTAGAGPGPPSGAPGPPPSGGSGRAVVVTTPGGLAALAEGGSSLASPAGTTPSLRPSEHLLDACSHTPLDVRDSGDCAGMGDSGGPSAPGQRAQGDAGGHPLPAAVQRPSETASPEPPVLPASAPDPNSIPLRPAASTTDPANAPVRAATTPPPHALLVQAVCSRSQLQLAAAQSSERLLNTVPSGANLTLEAATGDLAGPPRGASVQQQQVQAVRSKYFDANASDLFLSTTASLSQGLVPSENKVPEAMSAAGRRIPEVIVTAATPASVTPPDTREAAVSPDPVSDPVSDPTPDQAHAAALEPAGAPPPPPPTPAQESAQNTPDRKNSPVTSTVTKKVTKVAAKTTTSKQATAVTKPSSARREPGSQLSSPRVGGSTSTVGAAGAKDDASVTLIKAPPRAAVRPPSARSVRSATTTGTVTSEAVKSAPSAAAVRKTAATCKAAPPGLGTATKSASATANRKVSITAKDVVVPRLELSGARPKSTNGPASARSRPPRELGSLCASEGGGASPRSKQDGTQLVAKTPVKQEALVTTKKQAAAVHRPGPPRVSKDGLAATGAGEDIGELKATGSSAEGFQSLLKRVDDELRGVTSPFLVLVAELASRHGVLVDVLKNFDAALHHEEAQFAATLAHRQADALKMVGQQSDVVRGLVRAMWSEGSNMQALLEKENTALVQKLKDCTTDLELERAAGNKARIAKAALDSSVKQMRTKAKELESKMEAKAAEDEAKLKEQAAQVHTLKEKLRARGVVLDQRTKELEAAQARISELQSLESAKVQLDSRLGSVTQMLQIETKTREKAEQKLKATSAKLSQMEMARVDVELEEIRAERDRLNAQLEEQTNKNSADLEVLRTELKKVMEQLELRSRQLDDKDAELRHFLSLRPGEPSKEEVDALKMTLADLANHNDLLEKELSHCRQELAQRDKVMAEQENVLRVRDELLNALDQQGQGTRWPQELVDGRKMIEMDANFQRIRVKCKAQAQTIRQQDEEIESNQKLRTLMEMRIAQLEHLVAEAMSKEIIGKHGAARCNVALM